MMGRSRHCFELNMVDPRNATDAPPGETRACHFGSGAETISTRLPKPRVRVEPGPSQIQAIPLRRGPLGSVAGVRTTRSRGHEGVRRRLQRSGDPWMASRAGCCAERPGPPIRVLGRQSRRPQAIRCSVRAPGGQRPTRSAQVQNLYRYDGAKRICVVIECRECGVTVLGDNDVEAGVLQLGCRYLPNEPFIPDNEKSTVRETSFSQTLKKRRLSRNNSWPFHSWQPPRGGTSTDCQNVNPCQIIWRRLVPIAVRNPRFRLMADLTCSPLRAPPRISSRGSPWSA
jgi:hypothetical protein